MSQKARTSLNRLYYELKNSFMKLFVYLILSLICLPFFAVGTFEMYSAVRELESNARTIGTVTGNVYSTTNFDGTISGAYHPTVEFTNLSGSKTSFTDAVGSFPADYESGAQIEVYFEPNKPHNARIYSWKRFWLAPLIFILVGALPVLIAGIISRRLNL
jgi:hypothetical protein